ncbi:type II toxin-antitoxin system HicB family antitoxin [Candidatus Peregrinibacteria bacterium]|nr:type II toxin-antitoxin system HicB family antitoxin [Candidatus Peregrinibacteria bacterium]
MAKISVKSVVWQEGKYYVARCLNVEVSSFGETRQEALANLDEALDLYFEDQKKPKVSPINRPQIVSQSLRYA